MENMTSFTKTITEEEKSNLSLAFYKHTDEHLGDVFNELEASSPLYCLSIPGDGLLNVRVAPGDVWTLDVYENYNTCFETKTQEELNVFKFVTIKVENIDWSTNTLSFEFYNTTFTQFEVKNKELFDFVNNLTLGYLMTAVEKVSGEKNLFQVSGKIFCGRVIEFTDLNKTKGFIRDIYPMDGGFVLVDADIHPIPENLLPFYDESENVNGGRAFAIGFDAYETLWTVC